MKKRERDGLIKLSLDRILPTFGYTAVKTEQEEAIVAFAKGKMYSFVYLLDLESQCVTSASLIF